MSIAEKTEYRIIPYKTYIGDLYLQFKTVDTVKKFWGGTKIVENWRFVPDENYCVFGGHYLTAQECPTTLYNASRFLHCFHGHQTFTVGGLTYFSEMWPNINDYFAKMQLKRKEHLLKEENDKKNAKIIYL